MKRKSILYLKLFSFLFIIYSCIKTPEAKILYKFPFSSRQNIFFMRMQEIKLNSFKFFESKKIREVYIVKFEEGKVENYLGLNGKEVIFDRSERIDISYNEKFLVVEREKNFEIFKLPNMNLIKEIKGNYPRFYKDSIITFEKGDSIYAYNFLSDKIDVFDKGKCPVIRKDKLFYFKSGKVFILDLKNGLKDSLLINGVEFINPDVSFNGSKLSFISDFKLMVYDIKMGNLDTFKMDIEYGGYSFFKTSPPYPRWTFDDRIIMRNKEAIYLFIPETMEIVEIVRNFSEY